MPATDWAYQAELVLEKKTKYSFPKLSQMAKLKKLYTRAKERGRGGGVPPVMAYTGKLRPQGVTFSGFRYIKGL